MPEWSKRIIEYSCIGILLILTSPILLIIGCIWLFVAPFALIYEIGTAGWDQGISNWKSFFL